MKKRVLLAGAAVIAAFATMFSGVSPAAAASALPHWGPWMLCNTSSANDYDVRVHVGEVIGGVRRPDTIGVRNHGSSNGPAYDTIGLGWFNGSGGLVDSGVFPLGADKRGPFTVSFNPFAWAGTANPQAQISLDNNGAHICSSNKVLVG